MKKNKSKKIKKQFKKLLHEHINKAIEEKDGILQEKPRNDTEKTTLTEKGGNKNSSNEFVKGDILKTVIIASFLIVSMIIIGYYFNKNNLFGEVINFISNLF